VTIDELRPFAEAMFRGRDANADGALTREEIRPERGHHGRGEGRGPGGGQGRGPGAPAQAPATSN